MKNKILNKNFFDRSALIVAKDLLGKYLVRHIGKKSPTLKGLPEALKKQLSSKGGGRFMITEVEAYSGFNDKASHASRGKTKRNAPMFGEAGRWYVYFTYGMHWMLNAVTGPEGFPAAVLIRGVEDINGPGRLTKHLGIDKKFSGKIILPKTGIWIEDRGVKIKFSQIKRMPRIGVTYAGPVWSKKKWRFVIDNIK
jgi:DNA-3-methyladenine glycosylase